MTSADTSAQVLIWTPLLRSNLSLAAVILKLTANSLPQRKFQKPPPLLNLDNTTQKLSGQTPQSLKSHVLSNIQLDCSKIFFAQLKI